MRGRNETQNPTPKKREKFLVALAECGNVSRAARIAGMNRAGLYRRRAEEEAFAREWDAAAAIGVEALEDEARRRAFEGYEEPVWYQGEQCGTVRKFSDTLLIVLLKAHKPEKYAERQKTEHSGGQVLVGASLPPEARDIIDRIVGKA